MNPSAIILICLLSFVSGICRAQEKSIAFVTGIMTPLHTKIDYNQSTTNKNGIVIGFRTEYSPPKAFFSFTSGIQYASSTENMMLPLAMSVNVGNQFKLKLAGGLVPIIRLNADDPDKTFVLGYQYGIGIDGKMNDRYRLIFDYTVWGNQKYYHVISGFGVWHYDSDIEKFGCFSIGLKYLINQNRK